MLLTGLSLIATAVTHLFNTQTLTSEDQEEDFVCNREEMWRKLVLE